MFPRWRMEMNPTLKEQIIGLAFFIGLPFLMTLMIGLPYWVMVFGETLVK